MFTRIAIAAFAALLACAPVAAAPPLEAYGQLPTLSNVALSPDGKTLAYVKALAGKRVIVVQTIGVAQPVSLFDAGTQKLRELQWADNTHLLITTSTTFVPTGTFYFRSEFFTAQYFDLTTKKIHNLLEGALGGRRRASEILNVIAATPQTRIVNGHTVVFVPGYYLNDGYSRYVLFRLDLTSGENTIASQLTSVASEDIAENWLIDENGNLVAEKDYNEAGKRWKLKLYRGDKNVDVLDVVAPIESPVMAGMNEDGTAIVVRHYETGEAPVDEQISLKDGKTAPWPHANPHLYSMIENVRTGKVIGGTLITDKTNYHFFDPRAETAWNSVKSTFKDATDVSLATWSDDLSKIIVHVYGPGYGDGYFFVDMTTHKAFAIGLEYDGIEEAAEVRWIEYPAGDGRTIGAYLTLPAKKELKNLPLIVLPHGGPHSRDYPGFDWLSQALASRGYAVLQPQFRGSDGFGKDHLFAGFGEFGGKMQTDLSDGVHVLAAKGLVDPKRVCIVGASYGGYAALAGATMNTGVYRCAVADAGLSDLHTFLSRMHWPRNDSDARGQRFWDRFLGVTDSDDPKLDALSPIKHIGAVSIPILLIHGRDDTVVPIAQSRDMADALKAAGKKVDFVILDGEDHWLSRSETRRQMLEATVKFIEANNPPN